MTIVERPVARLNRTEATIAQSVAVPVPIELTVVTGSGQHRTPRIPKIGLHELEVLSVQAPGAGNKVKPWPNMDRIFRPETCDRHLYLGSREQFREIPDHVKHQAKIHRVGTDAYVFMLRLLCGLESKKIGEYEIIHQIKTRWDAFTNAHPEQAAPIQRIMENLLEDQGVIRTRLLKDIKPVDMFTALKSLTAFKEGQTLLVIGDRHGITADTLRAFGKNTTRRAGSIILTHPDSSELQGRMVEIREDFQTRRIVVPVTPIPFIQVMGQDWNAYDHVIVCSSLSSDMQRDQGHNKYYIDQQIQSAWSHRTRSEGYLGLLKGVSTERNTTSQHWNVFIGDQGGSVIPYEAIKRREAQQINELNTRLGIAEVACENCAYSRLQRQRPLAEFIGEKKEEYEVIVTDINRSKRTDLRNRLQGEGV